MKKVLFVLAIMAGFAMTACTNNEQQAENDTVDTVAIDTVTDTIVVL